MLVDLSATLNAQTPVYPGDRPTKIEPAGVFSRDGWNDHYVSFNTHAGTHMDAPLHMIANGKTLDQFSIEQFVGHGRLIDVQEGFKLEKLEQASIQPNDIVFFRTGMSQHYHVPIYFQKYPVMAEEIADYLVKKKVKMIGVDACSVDSQESFPIHKILLDSDVLIIENLTNLEQLAGKEFKVYALPIKLDVDGAPARVIAEVKE